MAELQFAIRKILLKNGTENFVPLVRQRSRVFKNKWDRIIRVYDQFMVQDLDVDPILTHEDCIGHINGYKRQMQHNKEEIICLPDTLKL